MTASPPAAPGRPASSPLPALAAALGARDLHSPVSFGPLDEAWRPVSALWGEDRAGMARLLESQRAYSPELDAKGQSAYLISAYAHALATPAAEAIAGFGLMPDIETERLGYRLEAYASRYLDRDIRLERLHLRVSGAHFATDDPRWDGHPHALLLPDREALADHARAALERHMAPLILRLNAYSRLPVAALWRLVGDALAYALLEAGRRLGREDQAVADALAVLKQPGSPLANKEMRFVEIALVDGGTPGRELARQRFRARGGCCRYYTVGGGELCGTCVLRKPKDLHDKLGELMRGELGEA
ncbi:siderophore biosynthesis protein [Methylopila jiangsuensis]|uniref:Siderophore biosynthesis protein n=1 Tax=Methylopila jiangsuensis TaxID=586230 RepID=A0A9W6JHY5_9HYPH|nr:ferric iron reductase [Methylopila jiangsuensis]MDR6286336.1 hypothetical protein [Methylopila jiangsuensis]GLK76099.1 siderophore biosynthesis protein [Methylopila jiangsuensis]